MGFSEFEEETVYYVRLVCSVLSLMGSLFIIVVYFSFRSLRKHRGFRLVLYLSLSDLLFCTALFPGPQDDDDNQVVCKVQACVISFFGLATVLWTVAIATSAYRELHRKVLIPELYLVLAIYCLCAVLTALPFSTDSYGNQVEWCWISMLEGNRAAAIVWQLVLFYVPLWSAFCVNTYCVVNFYRTQVNRVKTLVGITDEQYAEQVSKFRHLLRYPMVMLVCWVFATVDQVYNYANGPSRSLPLAILHYGLASLQGLGNALVYGLNEEVRKELRRFNPCKKDSDSASLLSEL